MRDKRSIQSYDLATSWYTGRKKYRALPVDHSCAKAARLRMCACMRHISIVLNCRLSGGVIISDECIRMNSGNSQFFYHPILDRYHGRAAIGSSLLSLIKILIAVLLQVLSNMARDLHKCCKLINFHDKFYTIRFNTITWTW